MRFAHSFEVYPEDLPEGEPENFEHDQEGGTPEGKQVGKNTWKKEEVELPSLKETVEIMNKINQGVYGVKPFKEVFENQAEEDLEAEAIKEDEAKNKKY